MELNLWPSRKPPENHGHLKIRDPSTKVNEWNRLQFVCICLGMIAIQMELPKYYYYFFMQMELMLAFFHIKNSLDFLHDINMKKA
jgi:hypothetical protein